MRGKWSIFFPPDVIMLCILSGLSHFGSYQLVAWLFSSLTASSEHKEWPRVASYYKAEERIRTGMCWTATSCHARRHRLFSKM